MKPQIPWSEIDTVLLDMDGTILDLAFDNYFWLEYVPQAYAEKNQITLEQSREKLREGYDAIEGQLQWYCLDHWSEKLGMDIAELKNSQRDRVAFRPGAIQFLEFLKAQDKQTILVTNAHRKSLEIKLLATEFHDYFNDLVSSHDFGYPKEEQAMWQKLCNKFDINPARSLFIDDSVRILKAARKFGIAHVYGIAQPDLRKGKIDAAPFEAIDAFEDVISHA